MFALVVGEYRWDKTFILSLVLTIVLSFGVFMLGLYFCLVETCVYWDNKHLRFVTMFLNHKGYQDFRWDSIYAMTVLEEHDRYGTSYHLSISQDGKTRTVLKYLSEKDAYALTEHLTSIQDKVLSSK
ncbi:MAG: hypothetical protein EOP07_26550 [Proteobacteria bacterium]|nr:MAG: hypothetical protein EOP07_26550 [Pseudomonadota bacterium]